MSRFTASFRSVRLALVAPLLFAAAGGCQFVPPLTSAPAPAPQAADSTPGPAPASQAQPSIEPVSRGDLEASIDRGVAFLVASQNRDGSWGSATRTKGLNIYAPIPGAHHAFRAATTALCISALIETGADSSDALEALERGEQWLLKELPEVRRAEMTAIYNTWAHAYGISALARMYDRNPRDTARREQIRKLVAQQIDLLARYEFVGGGWGYYDFDHHLSQPGGAANSFTTATVLIAFDDARHIGVEVPAKLAQRGVRQVQRQRKPDFTYLYSANFNFYTMRSINQPGGSLGRTQACNAALRAWDDEAVTDEVVAEWLQRLFDRNGWLDMGRKRPVPHESYFAVAGYFFYYGHYYGAMCIDLLPPDQRPHFQSLMARTITALQEKDGSWWDYPLYDYHQPYGTSFALMTLTRCRATEAE